MLLALFGHNQLASHVGLSGQGKRSRAR